MFSSMLEFLQKLLEMKLKKQKKETKKVVKDKKSELVEEEKSVVEVEIQAKDTKEVKVEKKKEVKLQVKIWVLRILKWIIQIVEWFITFLISLFGALGFFIILVVLVLMIVIYGLMHLDFDIPESHIYSGNINEECIQGGQVLSQGNVSELNLGTLNGSLSVYQQNIFKTYSILDEFVKGDPTGQLQLKGVSNDIMEMLVMGIPASESAYYLFGYTDTEHDVLKDIIDRYDGGSAGTNASWASGYKAKGKSGTASGPFQIKGTNRIDTYAFAVGAGSNYVQEWKLKYPKPTSDIDQFWIPYAAPMAFMHVVGMGNSGGMMKDEENFKASVYAKMSELGIEANKDECFEYLKVFLSLAEYANGDNASKYAYTSINDDGNSQDNGYDGAGGAARADLLIAIFAASSDVDSERHFYNYSINQDGSFSGNYNATDAKYKAAFWGNYNTANSLGDISNLASVEYNTDARALVLNGKPLDKPLIRWIYDKYKDNSAMDKCWPLLCEAYGQTVTSYLKGFESYLIGAFILSDLGGEMPVVTGGSSAVDCDCYEGGSSGVNIGSMDISNVQEGQAQGPWDADLLEKINNRISDAGYGAFKPYYGKTFVPTANASEMEQWRVSSKWKVPYYTQSSTAGIVFKSNGLRYHKDVCAEKQGLNACGTYMLAYLMSAATGRMINPLETFAVGLELGIFQNTGGMVYSQSNFDKLKAYNIHITHMYGGGDADTKAKVDAVLEAGGLVGIRSENKNNIFVDSEHFFVITEKVGDKYNVYSATGFIRDTTDTYTWSEVTLGAKMYFLTENINRNSSNMSGGSAVEVPSSLPQTGLIRDYTDYVWFYDAWSSRTNQRKVADLWGTTGKQSDKGIATINGLYLVAVRAKFGLAGDAIAVVLENGVTVNCIIADIKGSDAAEWGHNYGGDFSVVEWEAVGDGTANASGVNIELGDWYGLKVLKIVNFGSYLENPNVLSSNNSSSGNTTKCRTQATVEGAFVETPGQFQGPWGDLTQYLDNLPEATKGKFENLVQYVGLKPINESSSDYKYKQDKWIEYNGKGIVRYMQGCGSSLISPETWTSVNYGYDTFGGSACGAFSTAAIASTLLGKYINPPELILAAVTYKYRNPNLEETTNMESIRIGKQAIFRRDTQELIFKELGLKVELAPLNQDKVDNCLNNNGMVLMCVVGSSGKGSWLTSGSHYVVIREKIGDKYLIYSSTNWSSYTKDSNRAKAADYEWSYDEIRTMEAADVNYVTP